MLTALTRTWIRSKHIWLAYILSLPLCLHASIGFAKTEQDIKAAYIYNFMKFIAWPNAEEQNEFTLCVIGDDPVIDKLKKLDSRTIRKQTLHVEHFYTPDSTINCQAVFVGESERKFIDSIIKFYSRTPTLTVSSVEGFVHSGGMIGFITLGNIIRFDINLKQARQTQLSISSKLLELANQVEQ